jgi:cytochrome c biogenesis protein CcmG/thiol:disulfide interchange protein DsbE
VKRRTALYTALGLGVVISLLVGVLATRKSAENALAASPLVNKAAPVLNGTTIKGEPFSLSAQRNRYVVVNFFASWCVPCLQEHPELDKFVQRHQGGDAELVSVLFDDDPASARAFFQRHGGDWTVVDDPGAKAALDFGVRGPPESFVVDRQGFVLTRIVGRVTADGLDRLLSQAKALGR